jgi:hypothetical protein
MVEWGDALCKCLSRQSRPTFVSIKFGRMEFQVLDRNRLAGGGKDKLSHGRRDSLNPLYALAQKGLMILSRDHRQLPPFPQTPHSLSRSPQSEGIDMASLQHARNLVCNFCWQNFFNTEQFQLLCLCQCEGNHCDNRITCKMTVQQINGSASNGCNWCSYMRTFTSREEETRDPDDVLSISLSDFYPYYSSPTGKNMYYLNMDLESPKRETRGGWALRIHAFTNSTDQAAPFVTAREIQTEVYSDVSRHQIRNWLAECADHSQCPGQVETILPTRVIEVAPAISPDRPRLLATAGKKGRYAALSYCWGSNSYGELRRCHLNKYLEHLDLEVLPQTLRDAIAVTKSISVPYLWVDALCILQDSEEDKSFEISMMEQVYRGSLVTIVAANSEGVSVVDSLAVRSLNCSLNELVGFY